MFELNDYTSVEIDSRKCINHSIYVCYKNNEKYIQNAINNGATLIIHKHRLKNHYGISSTQVKNIEYVLNVLLDYFYPYKTKLIGVTGTDGKTTTSLIIYHLINQVDKCGYIGTNGIQYNNNNYESINTTPDIVTIRKHLFEMSNNDINYVTIECSSEGILSNRLSGLIFDCLIYTNLSHEHLNTHKTMKNYLNTKLKLIKQLSLSGDLIVNQDEPYFKSIKHPRIYKYGLTHCYCYASNIKLNFDTTSFSCSLVNKPVITTLFGTYNIYNILASILVLDKYSLLDIVNFTMIPKIDGRFERPANNIIIDFAHTPNALENLLKNISYTTKKKIILIVGAAGNKDKTKRPEIGLIANKYADKIIITSEDPKDEPITNIFYDLIKKIKKEYYLVLFRKDAIKLGLSLLNENSILVIVGKGQETYENILNYKIKHNDFYYTKSLLNS